MRTAIRLTTVPLLSEGRTASWLIVRESQYQQQTSGCSPSPTISCFQTTTDSRGFFKIEGLNPR